MFADRWSAVSWPTEYGGRGLGIMEWLVFEEEYQRARAPARVSEDGIFLLAPTLLEVGTAAQKERFLPAHRRRRGDLVPGLVRRPVPAAMTGCGSGRATRDSDGGRLAPERSGDLGQGRCLRPLVLRDLPHATPTPGADQAA